MDNAYDTFAVIIIIPKQIEKGKTSKGQASLFLEKALQMQGKENPLVCYILHTGSSKKKSLQMIESNVPSIILFIFFDQVFHLSYLFQNLNRKKNQILDISFYYNLFLSCQNISIKCLAIIGEYFLCNVRQMFFFWISLYLIYCYYYMFNVLAVIASKHENVTHQAIFLRNSAKIDSTSSRGGRLVLCTRKIYIIYVIT